MIFQILPEYVFLLYTSLVEQDLLPSCINSHKEITVEICKNHAHGDIALNIAMVIARHARKNPIDIANMFYDGLKKHHDIDEVNIVPPGFINITVSKATWHRNIIEAIKSGENYGAENIGNNTNVNIEFISANPTGPMHIGHMRGAVYGAALAKLLEFTGYQVTREYYVNDSGSQINALCQSVIARCDEITGAQVDFTKYQYPGEYLIDIARKILNKFPDTPPHDLYAKHEQSIKKFIVTEIMQLIKNDIESMGIYFDQYTYESQLHESAAIDHAIKKLENKHLIYNGTLDPPKGVEIEDWEPHNQMLFKSSLFGDSIDRPLKKSDGQWTYFAADVAYHNDKIERGFDILINILGADHKGYIQRITAATSSLSDGNINIIVKTCNLVKLIKDNKPMKMSKRDGTYVLWKDVIDSVGQDIIKFLMLTRKNNTPLDFDLDQVCEQSQNNPVFYVQYAHARIYSVFRHASEIGIDVDDTAHVDLFLCDNIQDQLLIKKICCWPRIVQNAALSFSPHIITSYLHELAAIIHEYWNCGKNSPDMRFVQSDNRSKSYARLKLLKATAVTIRSGMNIIGVTPTYKM